MPPHLDQVKYKKLKRKKKRRIYIQYCKKIVEQIERFFNQCMTSLRKSVTLGSRDQVTVAAHFLLKKFARLNVNLTTLSVFKLGIAQFRVRCLALLHFHQKNKRRKKNTF